jgi:hypothetical protein
MTRVIVDADLRAKLHGLAGQVELCDEGGQTLGHFLPADLYKDLVYSSIRIPFTEEEMARRRQAKGGRSLAEIWKSLGRT